MIEGDIKVKGKELFLSEYKAIKSTPDNFKIQDERSYLYVYLYDKYTVVDESKAEILRSYDNLLTENVVFKFNTELVISTGSIV